jgi:hypothetical protein
MLIVFLHNYANAIWNLKGREGSHFLLLSFFFINFFDHIAKDVSIFHLKLVVAISLATSPLSPLQDTPLIPTTNLLQVIGFNLPQVVDYGHEEIFHSYFEPIL